MTLGRRKLTEKEGRNLKLLSGLMMLALGAVLVVAPALLGNALVGVALIAIALVLTVLLTRLPSRRAA